MIEQHLMNTMEITAKKILFTVVLMSWWLNDAQSAQWKKKMENSKACKTSENVKMQFCWSQSSATTSDNICQHPFVKKLMGALPVTKNCTCRQEKKERLMRRKHAQSHWPCVSQFWNWLLKSTTFLIGFGNCLSGIAWLGLHKLIHWPFIISKCANTVLFANMTIKKLTKEVNASQKRTFMPICLNGLLTMFLDRDGDPHSA